MYNHHKTSYPTEIEYGKDFVAILKTNKFQSIMIIKLLLY